MQNRTKLLLVSAALALALAGCGGAASSSQPASQAESKASSQPAASSAAASENTAAESTAASEQAAALDVDAAYQELLKANPISNPFEIAALNIEYDFGLAAEDVVSYKGVRSNDNGDAGLVLVIETPADKVDTVRAALETYQEDQVAFYGNYAEFAQAQANVENAAIGYTETDSAGLVLMVIPSNEAEGGDAVASAMENAIDAAQG